MPFYLSVTALLLNNLPKISGAFDAFPVTHHNFSRLDDRSIHFTILPVLEYDDPCGFESLEEFGSFLKKQFKTALPPLQKTMKMEFYEIRWYEAGVCFQLRSNDDTLAAYRDSLHEWAYSNVSGRLSTSFPKVKSLLTPRDKKSCGSAAYGSYMRNSSFPIGSNNPVRECLKLPTSVFLDIEPGDVKFVVSDASLENSGAFK